MPMLESRNTSEKLSSHALTALVLAPLVVGLTLLNLYQSWQHRDSRIELAKASVQNHARLIGEHASRSFQAVDMVLTDIREELRRVDPWTMDPMAGHSFLERRQVGAVPQLRDLIIFDRDGRQRFHSSLFPAPRINVTDRGYFRAHRNLGVEAYVSAPFRGRNTKTWTFAMTRRLGATRSNFEGVVFAAIEPRYFEAFYRNSTLHEKAQIALLYSDNRVMASYPSTLGTDSTIAKPVGKLSLFSPLSQQELGQPLTIANETVFAFVNLDGAPLRVGLAVPLEGFLADWRKSFRQQLFFAATVMLLMLTGLAYAGTRERRRSNALMEETERGTKAREARVAALMNVPGHEIVLIDSDGIVRLANGTVAERLGRAPGELAARPYAELFSGGDDDHRRELIAQVLEGDRPREMLAPSGSGWTETTVHPVIDADGRRLGAAVHSRDMTESVRTMEQLANSRDEAERASAAKSRFLAAASHDLRQPLQALNMFVEGLAGAKDDAHREHIIERVRASLDNLGELLNGLLDISKLDAGLIASEPLDVSLDPLLARLVNEFTPIAAAKGLCLGMTPTSLSGHSDPVLLERVLRNLIANAIAYTSRGRVLIGCRRRGGSVAIQVWDTGIGIDEKDREHVFEEFFQVGNQARNSRMGLGLGLAIVERLSHLLGHHVNCRSRSGRGSMFEIVLGRGSAPDTGRSHAALTSQPGERCCVAVIDDNGPVLEGLVMLLESRGHDVLAGTSGTELLGACRRSGRRPELIIADYRLNNGELGSDAIRRIQAYFASPLPGVLLTGDTAPERLSDARNSGFVLLHKPVRSAELLEAMNRILARRPGAQADMRGNAVAGGAPADAG